MLTWILVMVGGGYNIGFVIYSISVEYAENNLLQRIDSPNSPHYFRILLNQIENNSCKFSPFVDFFDYNQTKSMDLVYNNLYQTVLGEIWPYASLKSSLFIVDAVQLYTHSVGNYLFLAPFQLSSKLQTVKKAPYCRFLEELIEFKVFELT